MSTSASSTDTIKRKISELLNYQRPWFRKVIKYGWITFLCFILGLPLYVSTQLKVAKATNLNP